MPLYVRIVFAVVTALLFAVLVTGDRVYALPLVLFLVTLAATIYEESWSFDLDTRTAEHRFGVLFWFRRISVPFDEIASLEVQRFVRGSVPGAGGGIRADGAAGVVPPAHGSAADEAMGRRRTLVRPTYVVALSLVKTDGTRVRVDTTTVRGDDASHTVPQQIASFCEIPLESGL